MAIIGKILFNPQNPQVGQSVKIDVCDPNGKPYDNRQPDYVAINGVPGSSQYVQFPWQGTHTVMVSALGSAGPEQETATINVSGSPVMQVLSATPGVASPGLQRASAADLAASLLTARSHPGLPYGAYFSLVPINALVSRDAAGQSIAPPAGAAPAAVAPPAPGPSRASGEQGTAEAVIARMRALMPAGTLAELGRMVLPPQSRTTYEWDFGDGTRPLTTEVSYATHDFEPALGTTEEFQQFHVTVKLTRGGATTMHTRTLAVMNAYVTGKKRGYVQPRVEVGAWARKVGATFVGTATITNKEPVPLTLRSRQFIPIFEDNNQTTVPSPMEVVEPPIAVPANGSLDVTVVAPFSVVPGNAVGFTVVFGESAPLSTIGNVHLARDAATNVAREVGAIPAATAGTAPRASGAAAAVAHAGVNVVGTRVDPGRIPIHLTNPIEGLKIRVTAHFDVQPQDRISQAPRIGIIGIKNLVARNLAPELTQVLGGAAHLATPALAPSVGITERLTALGLQRTAAHALHVEDLPVQTPVLGQVCDPDNLPDNVPDGYVCQATPQTEVVITPGRFMNARKGDIVLAPGGNGIVGGLLLQVTPPQRYSHSGIMTRNHDQITHCTASQDRMMAYPVGDDLAPHDPANGFRPDVVKYGWPGAITQQVVDAVNSQMLTDPESGKAYPFNGEFNTVPVGVTIGGTFTIVPPLVVKPDPMEETTALRTRLHQAADDAAAHAGKAHYRFYCYTDPTTGEQAADLAPADAGWAAGTFPAVCSSYIWLAMKRNGINLEGASPTVTPAELSPIAKEAGAQIGPNTPDGLFFYSQPERQLAGTWLYNTVYNVAYNQTGWLGEALTKAAVHIGNQLCNAFANDDCSSTNDSTAWQTPGDANAVSPDNLMLWNAPDMGGVFGYAEPLIYRAPRYDTVTIYKWAFVPTKGTLSGHVTFNGAPLAGATIQLNDALTAFSQADGSYSLPNVPFGPYVLDAQFVQQDGTFLSAQVPISVQGTEARQDVALQLPPAEFRQIVVSGNIHLHWTYHIIVETNEDSNDTPFVLYLNVGPYGTHAEATQTADCHSAHVDFHVVADWQLDKSVTITFRSTLDGDGNASWGQTFNLPADQSTNNWWTHLEANNDTGDLAFSFANNVLNA